MAEVQNGRIMAPVGEKNGIARVLTSGQLCAPRAELVAKLERYIADERISETDRAMYAAQLEDVLSETEA